jgi:hypothetical protein
MEIFIMVHSEISALHGGDRLKLKELLQAAAVMREV